MKAGQTMTTIDHASERAMLAVASSRLLARSTEERQPTVVELARAAGLPRRKLTHRYRDLSVAFQVRSSEKWGANSPAATADRAKLVQLAEKYDRAQMRVSELEELLDTYAIVIEELRLQFEEQRRDRRSNV